MAEAFPQLLIGRVRVRDAGVDPLLTRLRAAHLLSSADLRPADLPPGAILFVRRLRDPLPGALDLRAAQALPARAWERAARAALVDLLRRAHRPIAGPPPATAESVLFADQAELLACLALDWLGGLLPARWWWAQQLRAAGPRQAVLAAWADAPEYLPVALAHLSARGQAVAFATMLSESEATSLLDRVVARYGLRHLAPALASLATTAPAPAPAAYGDDPAHASTPPARPGRAPAPPWSALLPPRAQALSASQLLLGLGLALVHQPQAARGELFAQAVRDWLDGAHAPAPHTPRPAAISSPLPAGAPASARPSEAQPDTEAQPGTVEPAAPAHEATWGTPAPPAPSRADATPTQELHADAPAPPTAPPGAALPPEPGEPAATPAQHVDPLAELEIETGLGGLFYLLNLAIQLGLYGDFTTPEDPGIDLPVWDFLALLGGSLAGDTWRDDPLWALLARLRGGDEPPGARFAPPDEWRAPAAWLAPFDPAPCRWSRDAGRLRLWTPAAGGFWLAEVRAEAAAEPGALLAGLAPPGSAYTLEAGAVPAPRVGPLERWVDWLAAYARARLSLALAVQPDEVGTLLLAARGRVHVAAARLDVLLHLDELPVAVRIAGLDRDPGWVPAAGRWVAFHFR